MPNTQESSSQDLTGQDSPDLVAAAKGAASIGADASIEELAAAALVAPDEVVLHPRLAGFASAEREAFLAALSLQAKLLLALSDGCPAWIRDFDQDATLFLEVYRHRSFLLEDFIFESEETRCAVIASAEGRIRYRFEASLADCLLPDHAEGLSQLLLATADPTQIDPDNGVALSDILDFGTLAEKDMEEMEFVGIGVSRGKAHAVIDCRDDDPSEMIEATKRLLDLSSDPEGFSQLLARMDHEEINDVQMQLQEALGEEEDHPLFDFDNIDAALDMDNDEGWRWCESLVGDTSEPMLLAILQHLDELAAATRRAVGDEDDDYDEDDEDGAGWDPSYSILEAESPFQRLLGGAQSAESLYTWEITTLKVSS